MTTDTDFRWSSAARTDPGLVRARNEDACLEQPQHALWVVADGMGGHALGDFASRAVVEGLRGLAPGDALPARLAAARSRLQAVNRQLCDEALARGAQIIGSTVVVLLARKRSCCYLWAGDSRIYLYREQRLIQLTRDHSQYAEYVAVHGSEPGDGARYPPRNLITRAVGAAADLVPDDGTLEVNDGDMFLLCSDGLSNEVDDQDIGAVLDCGDCGVAADALVDMALRHGGRDNVTVIVVRADDAPGEETTVLNPAL